ncbi:hypothetical protein A2841_02025 [Candidatus Kaiserbacteria bacterium RIFCSPHIGHO2_01_FULL_48_10]|uniref:Uncharacterized protein n=1 Tax=Candidatus Kaiserbacteria bacterium RIFCSPHIGHO2_01_FULL_48_10 TaxID=1798476 RepID=A0A1F6C6F1_9BACT|nr:MAG: hypothetical protein A2841_02025 [Candidatus Kaiserbacteria bacterium RIFCSPHIGHO2_01_FULL_48_10]HLD00035.1 hypothetical protein [Patescibacteria group bacterium]
MHSGFRLRTRDALLSNETVVTIRFASGTSAHDGSALELVFQKIQQLTAVGTAGTLQMLSNQLDALLVREAEARDILVRLGHDQWIAMDDERSTERLSQEEATRLLQRYRELRPYDPNPLACGGFGCGG